VKKLVKNRDAIVNRDKNITEYRVAVHDKRTHVLPTKTPNKKSYRRRAIQNFYKPPFESDTRQRGCFFKRRKINVFSGRTKTIGYRRKQRYPNAQHRRRQFIFVRHRTRTEE